MSKAYHVYIVNTVGKMGASFARVDEHYKTVYDKTEAKNLAVDAYANFVGISGAYVVDEDSGERIGEWGSV